MFSVVITEKGGAQRRLDFDKNEVTIGRVQGNDIILPKGNVSKRHSRIVLKDNRFIVVDLKSTNGTYVNGRKITSPLVVKSGDKIYIGDFIMTLEEAAGVQPSPASHGDFGAPAPQMAPQQSMPQQGMAPQQAAPPPMAPPQQQYAPPPQQQMAPPQMPPQMAPPQMQPPSMGQPPMGQSPMAPPPMGQPPMGQPSQGAPAMSSPVVPVGGDRRPPPLRSAPPPPRQPTLNAGGIGGSLGAPPPLPRSSDAPRVPSEPPPAPRNAEQQPGYHLDEEPADETMAPSPRVISAARPGSRPEYVAPKEAAPASRGGFPANNAFPASNAEPSGGAGATEAPPPRMQHAPVAEEPRATTHRPQRREVVARAHDPRDPLGYVLATLGQSIDIGSLLPPEVLSAEHWTEARSAADAAVERLEGEGGTPGDRDALAKAAVQEALGLGPLSALLEDVGVLEIVVEGPTTILVDRGAGLSPSPGHFSSADQLITVIGRLVSRGGGAFDPGTAMHEATLPDGGHLLAVLPPVAIRGPILEIRRTGRVPVTGESLVQQGMITADMLGTLRAAISARRNVVVVGAGDVGVTAFASMLTNLADPEDRVLAIEPAPELALSAAHVVRLSATSTVSLWQLLANGPRLRADRVVVDGVNGAETRAALLLLASRGGGCVLGVRSAPSASALDHIEALAGLEGANDTIGRLLASAVHVVVRLGRDANGVRRALSIAEITSDDGIPTAQELWSHAGEFSATGHTATFQR